MKNNYLLYIFPVPRKQTKNSQDFKDRIILWAMPVGYIIQCNANESKQKTSHMSVWVPQLQTKITTYS